MEQKQNEKQEKHEDRMVRLLSYDVEGKTKIYVGLTKVKGISWSLSNAVCKLLNIDKNKKVGALTPSEIEKIEAFMKNPSLPGFLKNRRKDFESGDEKHIIGTDLELTHEFDIKRLRKIKSYRGYRHASGLPMRGQRTKSNFRRNKAKGAGIKKKNKKA